MVHPVTHAVANTLKRVVTIAAAILFFNKPLDANGYIGMTTTAHDCMHSCVSDGHIMIDTPPF